MSRSLSLASPPVTKAWARTTERVLRAGGEVGADPVHRGGQHRFVSGLLHAEPLADEGGFEVGQAVEGDVPVGVGEDDRGAAGGGVGAQVYAGAADESGADAEAAGGVVVAGDHHRGHAGLGEAVQGLVEQFHGGEGGTALSYTSPETSTASTSRARTVSTRCARNPAWASSMFTRWNDRPRCQSDVCSSLMIPETNGRVRQRGRLLPYRPDMPASRAP